MLKEKLMKHLGKKGKKDLDPMEKDAKMGVVKELSRQASSMMGGKVHPLMEAKVASDSKEGLKKGLDKAAGLIEHAPDMKNDPEEAMENDSEEAMEGAEEATGVDLDHDNEAGEDPAHKASILAAHSSPEEIDEMIAQLQALKNKKAPVL